MRVAFRLHSNRGLDDILQRRLGDAALHPLQAQLVGRNVPDFLVVGDEIFLRQPFSEMVVQPFFEIGLGRRIIVLDVVVKAFEAILRLQVEQAVFERIFYVTSVVEDFVRAAGAVDVRAQQRHHVIHHLLVAREDDVRTTGVEGEPFFLDGLAVPSAARVLFQDLAWLIEVRGNADARQAAA